jgi:hypothetical protein
MGDVTVLFIAMLFIGTVAFAPLAYFIYKFTQKGGKPFGEIEPHGDSPSLLNYLCDNQIALVKKQLKKQS